MVSRLRESLEDTAAIIPSANESERNEGSNDNRLPTTSQVTGAFALVRRFFTNVKDCGLSRSDSSHNVEKCVLSWKARLFKQKKFRAKVRQFHQ